MRERTRSLLTTFSAQRDQPTGLLLQDHLTSEIHLTPRPRLITGSMKTDSGTRRTETTRSREPKCTCSKDSSSHLTFSVSRPSSPSSTTRWSLELDISEIHTRNLISPSSHRVNASKLLGTVKSSSLEDWLSLKLKIPMLSQRPPSLIKSRLLLFPTPVTPKSWCAQPFALIWVAFLFHILEPTRDGFACAMDQSMTSSEESDKDQLKLTCHTSTTPCSAQLCALRSNSSLTSHPSSSTCESGVQDCSWNSWINQSISFGRHLNGCRAAKMPSNRRCCFIP